MGCPIPAAAAGSRSGSKADDTAACMRQAKHVLQQLSAIPVNGTRASCQQASEVLLQFLDGVATVSITAHSSGSGACVAYSAAGAGAELVQRQAITSGSSYSSGRCCSQTSPYLYQTVMSDDQAASLPQDWLALHRQAGLRTFLAVQITTAASDGPAGVLSLASTQPAAFMEEWWQLLLSMVATGLVPLLTHPLLAGITDLAGDLVDSSDNFLAAANTLLQNSAALFASVTNKHVSMRLGLLDSGSQDLLVLQQGDAVSIKNSYSSAGNLVRRSKSSSVLRKQMVMEAEDESAEDLDCIAYIAGCLVTPRATRVPVHNTMLSAAMADQAPAFTVSDTTDYVKQDDAQEHDDVFVGGLEVVSSITCLPLYKDACKDAFGAVYLTFNRPSSFSECKVAAGEVAGLLQRLLQEGSLTFPASWDALLPQSSSISGGSSPRSRSLSMEDDCARPIHPGALSSASNCSLGSTSALSTGSRTTSMMAVLVQELRELQDCSNTYVKELKLKSVLGSGGFGTAYGGSWQGGQAAIKVVCTKHDQGVRHQIKTAMEMAALLNISHPNIVRVFACLTDMVQEQSKGPEPEHTCFRPATAADPQDQKTCNIMVMERCDMSDLRKAVAKGLLHKKMENGGLAINMRLLLTVLLDVAQSLRHLHSMGLVHCDVKAENVLLQSSTARPTGFICKMGDFGLVKCLGEQGYRVNMSFSGTPTHLAPERFQAGSKVTAAVDSYAFGMLMWELYTGQRPFTGMQVGTVVKKVYGGHRPQFPASVPAEYKKLAEACWAPNTVRRPDFDSIVCQLQEQLSQAGKPFL